MVPPAAAADPRVPARPGKPMGSDAMRKIALVTVLTAVVSVAGAQRVRESVSVATRAATRPAPLKRKAPTTRPAETPGALKAARDLYRSGKYAEAVKAYKKLLDSPVDALPASIGLAEAHAITGGYEQARKALAAVAQRGKRSAEWHVTLSQVLAAVGKYDQALSSARKATELRGDWAPAILRLGEALEVLGKKPEAVKAYEAVREAIDKKGFRNDARSLVAAGEILARHAILTGEKASKQAQNILHNYFQHTYQKVDKKYWPAHVAAGMLLLEKHKPLTAGREFALAAKVNKQIPDVYAAGALILLQRYRFEQAIAQADKALRINPRHADALLVKAATKFLWRKYDQVAPELEKILKFNPNHLDALSMMAAVHVRGMAPEKAEPFIKRVEKVNPGYGQLYEAIADWLASGRQYRQAEKYYKKAMKMSPELAGPVAGLGKLYMQTGQEKLAEKTLEKAFAIDDYRGDVLNYLKLLGKLWKFKVKETENFIIKVDPKYDEVLLEWVARAAEDIHKDVAKDFDHTPAEKTLVELFPDHWGFSVRISGRGSIPTVGACTGRVIAMPAPDPDRGGAGKFNWAVVLRHEYTHTVTLSATGNRIPHWFTEACAVWEQPDRRNYQAVNLLVGAVRNKKLYPIKELSWGFIRPDRRRGPASRSLAYAQAEWVFEYIVVKKGYDAIGKMLKGFRDGWTQEKVFKDVLGMTQAEFDKDFRAWGKKEIVSWGFDADPRPSYAAASKAAKAKPTSADAQADLAYALLQRRRGLKQAIATARKALKIDPKQRRALEVLARGLSRSKKYDEAVKVAAELEKVEPRSAEAARVRAESHLARRRWAEAIIALEACKQRRPMDSYAYEKLAKLYDQLGQTDRALPNLIELHRRTMKDSKYARQIADIYRASNAPEKALEFYEQVIQINPYDAGAYLAMAGLYLRQKDHDGAILAARSACLIEPKNADFWTQLAAVYYRTALAEKSPQRLSEARAAAQKSIKLDPEGRGREVLQIIDEAEL